MKTKTPPDVGKTVLETLKQHFPGRVMLPKGLADVPRKKQYMVYVLVSDDGVILAGHGRCNRAQVIFDSEDRVAPGGHLKAFFVRLHVLFASQGTRFSRYLLRCDSKEEAKKLEKQVHGIIGGNNRKLPTYIENALFDGLTPHTFPWLFLQLALTSSFDGLADLMRWKGKGFIKPEDWKIISDRLRLERVIRRCKTK